MSENSNPNPLSPKLHELNTACERIDYALKRIAEKGWIKNRFRPWKPRTDNSNRIPLVLDGPGCLLGSLVTDDEMAQMEEDQFERTNPIHTLALPGLYEAAKALEFDSAHSVWHWNDRITTTVDMVLERLQAGKKRACV